MHIAPLLAVCQTRLRAQEPTVRRLLGWYLNTLLKPLGTARESPLCLSEARTGLVTAEHLFLLPAERNTG